MLDDWLEKRFEDETITYITPKHRAILLLLFGEGKIHHAKQLRLKENLLEWRDVCMAMPDDSNKGYWQNGFVERRESLDCNVCLERRPRQLFALPVSSKCTTNDMSGLLGRENKIPAHRQ